MLRHWLTGIAVLLCGMVIGQPFGNEWINYSRQYWRFNIVAEGLFRIDSTALADAGFPVGTVDPRDIQVFAFEEEQAIYVEGEGDGIFNGTDFIEFYAKGNDGWLDKGLWDLPEHQNNPFYSLYNDTIRYYLTWDATPTKRHVVMHADTAYSTQPVRPWYWSQGVLIRNQGYQIGHRDNVGASDALMVEGEGYFSTAIILATSTDVSQDYPVVTKRPYQLPDAPDAEVEVVLAGINNPGGAGTDDHHMRFYYGPSPGVLVLDSIFRGYSLIRFGFQMPASVLVNGNTVYKHWGIHDLPLTDPNYPDRQAVAYVKVDYPHDWHMDNTNRQMIVLPDTPTDDPAHVDFGNFAGTPILWAWGDSVRRILPAAQPGSRWKAMVPADPQNDRTRCYLFAQQQITNITTLRKVNDSGFFSELAPLNIDSAVLMVTHSSLMTPALQYAAYRESSPKSPAQTLVVDVDELYDQYGGGIPKHAEAIRRFAAHMYASWNTPPKALFLMGKSVQTPRVGSVPGSRVLQDTAGYRKNLVPTFGYPPSDVKYTLGMSGDPRDVTIPVGRISANTAQELSDYLQKVQVFESYTEPEEWMKNILFFRGGFTEAEWSQFAYYLSTFEYYAEDTCFGGNVTYFVKSSSNIYQQAPADSVANMIQTGVTLMTFFAHAAGGGFDISIDNPANYDWNGRFPMITANSCYAGNIHLQTTASASESFVLIPNKGAIAFLASVDIGLTHNLGAYTTEFYRSFSQVNYGGTIGEHMRHASFEQLNVGTDLQRVNNVQTFTLEGDPMVILNSWPEPDYVITPERVDFLPYPVNASLDTFQLRAIVTNIGKATSATPALSVTRTLQDGTQRPPISVDLTGIRFRDTALVSMPVLPNDGGTGLNQFDVTVDLDPDEIPEFEDVLNNMVNKALLITSGDIQPVYPYEYAIIPEPQPVLKASTGDPFAPAQDYVFQIDTTDTFNSPMLESVTINAPGGVVSWSPSSIFVLNSLQDSTVYYWRCSPDSTGNNGYNWYESSFQYITDRTGWGQAHYFQFKKDQFDQIVYDRPQRDFDFYTGQRSIRCLVQGSSAGATNDITQYFIDLTWQEGNGCFSAPGMHVAVIDPATFSPWGTFYGTENPDHQFGNQNNNGACRSRVERYFIFKNDATQLPAFANMLQNEIPDGHYVVVYTWKYLNRFLMDGTFPGALDQVEALGGTNVRLVNDSVPYILICKKGDPGSAQEAWGQTRFDMIQLQVNVDAQGDRGQITAPLAGPAFAWDALYWNEVPNDVRDSTRIQVFGRTPQGSEQLLYDLSSTIDSLTPFTVPAFQVDAAQYPWLRVKGAFVNDSVPLPKPAQLQRWQLLNAPAPECAIDPPSGFFSDLDGLFAGQSGRIAIAVRNISPVDMDSLLLSAWVIDRNNVRHTVRHRRLAPLLAGGVVLDTIEVNTLGFGGLNTFIAEANSLDSLTGRYDQYEQYHFNNIAQLQFEVEVDRENPLLDVTFDGVHILDGDIVSSRPEVQVTLDDENPVLLLDSPGDTTYFTVFLADPNGGLERIYFRSGGVENMQFVPADGPKNVCRIFYRPTLDQDGTYTLIVQARDISANISGDHDYKVSFEVINRPTITEVLNYPNPFTTSTRFVFTVTGKEPPSYMKIQIMTVTGRVVREVPMHELGPIRVGRNITEFAWDGTDEFGDRLARGVYLYRVYAKLHGEDIEIRSTGASGYFKEGYGKMYLLQ